MSDTEYIGHLTFDAGAIDLAHLPTNEQMVNDLVTIRMAAATIRVNDRDLEGLAREDREEFLAFLERLVVVKANLEHLTHITACAAVRHQVVAERVHSAHGLA